MARHEQDREDLIAEATALVQRAELQLPEIPQPVVIGFRASGGASLYVGGDEAWHFTSQGQLRRAFLGGVLYKAQRGELVALQRQRTAQAVHLVRQPPDALATDQLRGQLRRRLDLLQTALQQGTLVILRQVPAEWHVLAALQDWLSKGPGRTIADRPHVS